MKIFHAWPGYAESQGTVVQILEDNVVHQVAFVAYVITAFESLKYGGGVHQWDVQRDHVVRWAQVIDPGMGNVT